MAHRDDSFFRRLTELETFVRQSGLSDDDKETIQARLNELDRLYLDTLNDLHDTRQLLGKYIK
jgi:hypothetical protein